MSSTPAPEQQLPLQRMLSRPVIISAAALVLGVVLAWGWLIVHATPAVPTDAGALLGMADMSMAPSPWTAGYLSASFIMWSLMMVAMMMPSAAPMILLHARVDRGTAAERRHRHLLFVLCYVAIWISFSALAAVLQAALIRAGLLSPKNLMVNNPWLTGGLLLTAAAWQLTSAKASCLEHCQSPIRFVMRYWRPGAAGAARLGLAHGVYCLGCCWSLMLLLFVGGVMNLAWVAALAALVFTEKLAPPAWQVRWWLSGTLIFAALVLVVS